MDGTDLNGGAKVLVCLSYELLDDAVLVEKDRNDSPDNHQEQRQESVEQYFSKDFQ